MKNWGSEAPKGQSVGCFQSKLFWAPCVGLPFVSSLLSSDVKGLAAKCLDFCTS